MVSLMPPETFVWPLPLQVDLVRPAGFFFNDTASTEIYTLSLHDALPILKLVPGTTLPVLGVIEEPPLSSVLVTLTSFCGERMSQPLALLLVVSVSLAAVTVTVLTSWAVAFGSTVAVTV